MKNLKFWNNFRYAIAIKFFDKEKQCEETNYVTAVVGKQFEYHSKTEILENEIKVQTFTLEQAVDYLNAMFCNGYKVSLFPYFEGEVLWAM